MREIRSRLRDRNNKIVGYEKWYPGSYNSKRHYWTASPCWLYSTDGQYWNPTPIAHSQKDQYIGFKDKNGKEIYEGDILCFTHFKGAKPFHVFWREDDARFCDWSPRDKVEIIGNIYENPELCQNSVKK